MLLCSHIILQLIHFVCSYCPMILQELSIPNQLEQLGNLDDAHTPTKISWGSRHLYPKRLSRNLGRRHPTIPEADGQWKQKDIRGNYLQYILTDKGQISKICNEDTHVKGTKKKKKRERKGKKEYRWTKIMNKNEQAFHRRWNRDNLLT